MIQSIVSFMNFTQLLVVISFIVVLLTYKRHNTFHKILLAILSVSLSCELLCVVFLYHHINISLVYSFNNILHHSLWLWLLFKVIHRERWGIGILLLFIAYAIVNLLAWEGMEKFNYNTFIFGSFLYLVFFIGESFFRLKKEDFGFFLSNNYLLIFAPVLFFFGLSMIFGFKSRALSETVIFGDTKLYTVIGYFINLVYYGLIHYYMFKEKKLRHEH